LLVTSVMARDALLACFVDNERLVSGDHPFIMLVWAVGGLLRACPSLDPQRRSQRSGHSALSIDDMPLDYLCTRL
jgi:hypothetical protein